MLTNAGWQSPDPEAYPTGRDLVEHYLLPLAALPALRPRIRLGTRVLAVTRAGLDKMKTDGRDRAPFLLMTRDTSGREEPYLARAVIDASGTYLTPNPLGGAGIPALGEREAADRMFYGIPDVLGMHRQRYAGRRVMVAGSGHSAFNILLDLITLRQQEPETSITWVIRRPADRLHTLFGGGASDALPARGELGERARKAVQDRQVQLVPGFRVTRLIATAGGIAVSSDAETLPPVDEIIVATGFRPDLSFLSEVRLSLDPAIESPVALAPLIDPHVHLLRYRATTWRSRIAPSGARLLHRGDEKLWPRPHVLALDRVRASSLHSECARGRLGGGTGGPACPAPRQVSAPPVFCARHRTSAAAPAWRLQMTCPTMQGSTPAGLRRVAQLAAASPRLHHEGRL
ncbi:MAG: hypothetical protein KatS3mg059_0376 [Thermomicrobiales bacterium]|nr:MAG: hypothetical protein KatS3mg059_0376 [Thermomicrobiales bacterium]